MKIKSLIKFYGNNTTIKVTRQREVIFFGKAYKIDESLLDEEVIQIIPCGETIYNFKIEGGKRDGNNKTTL